MYKENTLNFPFYYFHNGYRRVKRFSAWFPILWKDEDWDSVYLFEIMRFKISRMAKEMDINKRHVGCEKQIRAMKVSEELLKRFALSNFYYELSEKLENEEKRGKCNCPAETFYFEPYVSLKTGEHLGSLYVNLSCHYCKASKKRWFKRDLNKQKEDLDFLFAHLRKNIKTWWD